jgi:uncharacterized protein (DUF1800 family)
LEGGPIPLLDTYTGPWTTAEAAHLGRRAGFGAKPSELTTMVANGMSASVDALVNYTPINAALDAQIAALSGTTDRTQIKNPRTSAHLGGWLLYRITHTTQPLQEQFALFLHDHFVSDWNTLYQAITPDIEDGLCGLPSDSLAREKKTVELLQEQYALFREQGHLHFRDMLLSVTRDPAMLIYLDNYINVKGRAQENYARELMELFSMGVNNYTEDDVREMARALTGETIDESCSNQFPYTWTFRASDHDTDPKTIFGQTFNLPGAGTETVHLIDLIMDRVSNSQITPFHQIYPATAVYIGWKLLRWFVNDALEMDHPAVGEVAEFFHENNVSGDTFHVRETLRKIFKSQFFYDQSNRYCMFKHPVDFIAMAERNLGIEDSSYTNKLYNFCRRMGMDLFQPPNVAGWNHGQSWINSAFLITRFNLGSHLSETQQFTSAMVDSLLSSGAVSSYGDDAGLLEYFRARLIQVPLTSQEQTTYNNFLNSVGGNDLNGLRRRARGLCHIMLASPRYQLK